MAKIKHFALLLSRPRQCDNATKRQCDKATVRQCDIFHCRTVQSFVVLSHCAAFCRTFALCRVLSHCLTVSLSHFQISIKETGQANLLQLSFLGIIVYINFIATICFRNWPNIQNFSDWVLYYNRMIPIGPYFPLDV